MDKFKKSCEKLFDTFDSLAITDPDISPKWGDSEIGLSLSNYLIKCTPKLQKLVGNSLPTELWCELVSLSFGMGFVMGMTIEPTYPKTKEAIKNIKQTMTEEQLLPYFPREKKGGPT